MMENPGNLPSRPEKTDFPLYGLIFMLLFEIVWHVYLWINDFNALSTDEYLRLYFSASWAKNPRLFIPGEFLSFYFYIFGTMIKLTGNIVWSARLLSLLFSLMFTLYLYKTSCLLAKERLAGTVSVCLTVSSLLFMRISTVPLSETVCLAVIFASLYYLLRWGDSAEPSWRSAGLLLISQLLLAVSNGLRYESWLVTGCACFFVFFKAKRDRFGFTGLLRTALTAAIPVAIPALWLIMGHVYFEDSARFVPGVSSGPGLFKTADLLLYPKIFVKNYPLLALLLIPLAFDIKGLFTDSKRVLFASLSVLFFFFLVYISLRYKERHVVLPERTLLFFTSFVAPLAAISFLSLIKKTPEKSLRILTAFTVLTALVFSLSFAKFLNLPGHVLEEAKAAGLKIKKLERDGKTGPSGNILVEKSGWDWCVIYVESNLMGRIFFDRKSVLGRRMTEMPSELLEMDGKTFRNTLEDGRISHLVFKDPRLVRKIKKDLPHVKEEKTGPYSILSTGIL